jgi:hypothetical protein
MVGYGYQAETALGEFVGDAFWSASRILTALREFSVDVCVNVNFHF